MVKKVNIYAGEIGKWGDVVLVEQNVPATPEAVAEAANISLNAAIRALENPEDYTLAGWVSPGGYDIVEKVPADAEVIDTTRHGDPVFENAAGVWEPFYVILEVCA